MTTLNRDGKRFKLLFVVWKRWPDPVRKKSLADGPQETMRGRRVILFAMNLELVLSKAA